MNLMIERAIKAIVLICIFLYAVILIKNNFLFSSEFELLSLREIDDAAFQVTLRKMHEMLLSFNFRGFFSIVDYGYGNIFWILNAFITLPFYLLKNDQMVMVLPRLLSIAFYLMAGWYLYKIALLSGFNKIQGTLIVLLSLSFPAAIYAEQRFHTHCMVAFFTLYTVYMCLNPSPDKKRWFKILFFSGLVSGLKLTGMFILPFVGLLYLRENISAIRLQKKILIHDGLKFVIGYFVGLSPVLFLSPIYRNEAYQVLKTIFYYLRFSQTNFGGDENTNPIFLFSKGLSFYLINIYSLILLLVAWAVAAVKDLKAKSFSPQFFLFFSILLPLLYLLFRTSQGPWAVSNYYLPYAMLLPLGLQYFLKSYPKMIATVLLGLVLCLQLVLLHNGIQDSLNIYQARIEAPETKAALQEYDKLKEHLKRNDDGSISVLKDYRAPIPYSQMKPQAYIRDYFDNVYMLEQEKPFDYVVLHLDSAAFKSDQELEAFANKEDLFKNKKIINELILSNKLFGHEFQQIYKSGKISVYKRVI